MIEELGTTPDGDLIINVGPQHPSTHGVVHLVITLNGETATLGPQTHTLTISTSCTCTVATATGVVSGCVCPQTVSVTN